MLILVVTDHLPEFGVEAGSCNASILEDCQDVVIRWFTTFVQAAPHKINAVNK